MKKYAIDNKCGRHGLFCCVECNEKYFENHCVCDCECKKEINEEGIQCDDCDNGIHWDKIRKTYLNYEDEENLR